MKKEKKNFLNKILNVYIALGVGLWALAALVILTPVAPALFYSFSNSAHANEIDSLTQGLESDREGFEQVPKPAPQPVEPEPEPIDTRPPLDLTLPRDNTILINNIGVSSKIEEGADFSAALNRGPWIVNDFPTPDAPFSPVIIASHRWGGVGWSTQQRTTKSFYKLPDLKPGDKITIIWEQRAYEYEVYEGEENTQITDYDADLILYTCKLYWSSPIRIFQYAKRVN